MGRRTQIPRVVVGWRGVSVVDKSFERQTCQCSNYPVLHELHAIDDYLAVVTTLHPPAGTLTSVARIDRLPLTYRRKVMGWSNPPMQDSAHDNEALAQMLNVR